MGTRHLAASLTARHIAQGSTVVKAFALALAMLGTSAGLAPSAAAQGEPPVSPTIIDEIMAPGETLEVGYRILKNFPQQVTGIPPAELGRTTGGIAYYSVIAAFPRDPLTQIAGCGSFFDEIQLELISDRADPDDFWISLNDLDPPLDILGTPLENVLLFTGELVLSATLGTERLTVSLAAAAGDLDCNLDFFVVAYRAGSVDPVLDPVTFIGRQEVRITVGLDSDGDGVEDALDNCPQFPNNNQCVIPGDRDGNGDLNVIDVILVLNEIVRNTPESRNCTDANLDGSTNILDAVLMLNIIVGNQPPRVCSEEPAV
jgi:hypothetical protein